MKKPIKPGALVKFKDDLTARCGYGIVIATGRFDTEVYWLSDGKIESTFTMVLEEADLADLPEL